MLERVRNIQLCDNSVAKYAACCTDVSRSTTQSGRRNRVVESSCVRPDRRACVP
jgi:hypothetical protein